MPLHTFLIGFGGIKTVSKRLNTSNGDVKYSKYICTNTEYYKKETCLTGDKVAEGRRSSQHPA